MACVVLLLGIGSALCFDTYYMDHQVTEKHAREAIDKAYNHSLKRNAWDGTATMSRQKIMDPHTLYTFQMGDPIGVASALSRSTTTV